MILVCGILADPLIELMCARLTDLGRDFVLLDELDFPGRSDLCWTSADGAVSGYVSTADRRVDLADVTGVYVRYVEHRGGNPRRGARAAATDGELPLVRAEYQQMLIRLLEALPCVVANRASASVSNDSKVYQGFVAGRHGFRVPRTLVTTDPAAAAAFYEAHGRRVIFKSLSSVRSIVRLVTADDLGRLGRLPNCPTQFQECVDGTDVRVHVVGDRVFPTEVESDALDYRYARREGKALALTACDLPADVAGACVALTRDLGLVLSGVDLRRTPDGTYCCFESQPVARVHLLRVVDRPADQRRRRRPAAGGPNRMTAAASRARAGGTVQPRRCAGPASGRRNPGPS